MYQSDLVDYFNYDDRMDAGVNLVKEFYHKAVEIVSHLGHDEHSNQPEFIRRQSLVYQVHVVVTQISCSVLFYRLCC